jgi:hypothetical protein
MHVPSGSFRLRGRFLLTILSTDEGGATPGPGAAQDLPRAQAAGATEHPASGPAPGSDAGEIQGATEREGSNVWMARPVKTFG